MKSVIKIAIVGPESTGKSALTTALANHFHCSYVPEVAREYLDQLGRPYQENDLHAIAKKQILTEDNLSEKEDSLLICDTTLLVIRIWSDVKYGHCEDWILEEEKSRDYDLFLLTYIDLPWEEDPLREHPHFRDHLYQLYFDALTESKRKFEIISGTGPSRIANALKAIEKHFQGQFSKKDI